MEIKRAERQKASPEMLRIANTILCNYSMVNKASLPDGRMGVCLFLYEYARLTEKKEYEELADNMVDEILNTLNKMQNENNICNLSGIGMGIVYLITHQFIEDTDEHDSLEELDMFLSKTIETAKELTETFVWSALYFIYRFLNYRIGIERKHYHRLAKHILMLFRNPMDKRRVDNSIASFVLQNAKQMYKISHNAKTFQWESLTFFELALNTEQEQTNAEYLWFCLLFNKKDLKKEWDENVLFNMSINCFYDAERTVGNLCHIALCEINKRKKQHECS